MWRRRQLLRRWGTDIGAGRVQPTDTWLVRVRTGSPSMSAMILNDPGLPPSLEHERLERPGGVPPAAHRDRETPVLALGRSIAAGLAATLVLSALSRVLPGLWNEQRGGKGKDKPLLPEDPHDPEQVR